MTSNRSPACRGSLSITHHAIVAAAVSVVLCTVAFADPPQAVTEPIVGTWRRHVDEPMPADQQPGVQSIARIASVPGGISLEFDSTNPDGNRVRTSFTAKFDGKDYPAKSTIDAAPDPHPAVDAVSIHKLDDRNYQVTGKSKGEIVTVVRWVVSDDGSTRTVYCVPFVAERACPPVTVFDRID